MEKITVTRGLTKLKTLDRKIRKAIQEGCYISYKVGGKQTDTCNAKSDYQSVVDLIDYRDRLKAAISESNAKTKVKIAGKEMTVVEAIEKKGSIQYKVELLTHLRTKFARTRDVVEDINSDVQRRLDRIIEASVGSEKQKTEIEAITKPFLQRNEAKIVDELKIEEKIKELDEEITSFLEQIDVTLSEINAMTYIEV